MSWREFSTLLSGLNPHGAVAMHYSDALKEQERTRTRTQTEQQAAASSFWASVASI